MEKWKKEEKEIQGLGELKQEKYKRAQIEKYPK